MIALPILALLLASPAEKPVTLAHVFKLGQKMSYLAESKLEIQSRQRGLETFIPEEQRISYAFTTHVTKMKADGIAVLHYLRPQVTMTEGETAEHGPIPHVEKTKDDVMFTLTPLNEVIEVVEKDKPKKTGGGAMFRSRGGSAQLQGLMGSFLQEVYRLAMFQGGQLDFSPRLPLDEVAVGDTWKRTVSYQPQKLKGKSEQAVQRLDYTYTFNGVDTWNGKKVYKVTAAFDLNTDLAVFFNQMFGASSEESGLKSIPLKLHANVLYYLDFNSMHTVAVDATSSGGFSILLTAAPNEPVVEQKIDGVTTLRLVGVSQVPVPK